jgi:hypothetical protein
VIAIVAWLIAAIGFVYLAIAYHRWFYWAFAVGWVAAAIERLVKHSRKMRQYESQK